MGGVFVSDGIGEESPSEMTAEEEGQLTAFSASLS